MNIYEKLQTMRCELQDAQLHKSGKNTFAGYEYFELQDIIPTINKLMQESKVTSVVSFGTDHAELVLINIEKPEEKVVFTSPMAKTVLKGCNETQGLGATITYIRRYLYINAFEIVENDALDAVTSKDTPKPAAKPATKPTPQPSRDMISDPQAKRLYAIAKGAGWSDELIKEHLLEVYGLGSSRDILRKDYEAIVSHFEKGNEEVPV